MILKKKRTHRFLILNIHKNSGLSNFLIKLKRTGNLLSFLHFLWCFMNQFEDGMFHCLEINMLLSQEVVWLRDELCTLILELTDGSFCLNYSEF